MVSKNDLKQNCKNNNEKETLTFGEYLKNKERARQIERRRPVGCSACGNPAYPNCKLSCPLFDD